MIILVFGLPGTGKSSFSKRLKGETRAHYLSTDIVRDKLNKKGNYDEISKQFVYDRLAEVAKTELSKGRDVIVDGTFHKYERRQMFIKIAKATGHELFLIEIKASGQTVKKRLEKKRKYSDADYEIYKKIKKEFDHEPRNHLVLWSDQENPGEMISKAMVYITQTAH